MARRLPPLVGTMIRIRLPAFAPVLLALSTLTTPALALSRDDAPPATIAAASTRRIRTTDRYLLRLIEKGVRQSETFRLLVERIDRSDVVVYIRCEGNPQARVAGRLTFVSAAGGLRYVVVRVARMQSSAQQIAMIAHELQHAVEIADTPAIVDGPSLAREYSRMGHVNHWSELPGIAFDTQAAVSIGRKVMGEVRASPNSE